MPMRNRIYFICWLSIISLGLGLYFRFDLRKDENENLPVSEKVFFKNKSGSVDESQRNIIQNIISGAKKNDRADGTQNDITEGLSSGSDQKLEKNIKLTKIHDDGTRTYLIDGVVTHILTDGRIISLPDELYKEGL